MGQRSFTQIVPLCRWIPTNIPNRTPLAPVRRLRFFNDAVAVFQTDRIAQSSDCYSGSYEIPELPVTIQVNRTDDNVIVNVGLVGMRSNYEGMLPLREPPGQFLAQTICLLWCDFSRDERLTKMIADHIVPFSPSPGFLIILCFCLCELCLCHERITGVSGHQFSAFCFIRIFHITEDLLKGAMNFSASPSVECNEGCGCDEITSLFVCEK